MMAKRIPDELEDFNTEELCNWLRTEQNCDDTIIQAISDTVETETTKPNETEIEEDVEGSDGGQLIDSLKKMSQTSRPASVLQMLRLTLEERIKNLKGMPEKGRFQELQKMFPVFLKPEFVIYNMMLQLPKETTIEVLKDRVVEVADSLLDYSSSKGTLKFSRSLLKTNDQKVVTAYSRLPLIVTTKVGNQSQKPALTHSFMHVAKIEETWQDVAKEHRGQPDGTFWIMAQKVGDKMAFLVFTKDEVLLKCSSAAEAILSLISSYYLVEAAYPSNLNGALLFIQQEILQDLIHEKDVTTLNKAMKSYQTFLETVPEENIF